MTKEIPLPKHIAIIMDGNGRWARSRLLPRTVGHREGIRTAQTITKKCIEMKIEYLTLFAFSTENWNRPKKEVDTLWKYLDEFLKKESQSLIENNVRLRMIGIAERIPADIMDTIDKVAERSRENTGMTLVIALNYSGRSEIIRAVNECISLSNRRELKEGELDEQGFRRFLFTADIPDPDLLIRTGNEIRISNFLLFQCAYTELYFSPRYWPDFSDKDLMDAIESYKNRTRKFGSVSE